MKQMSLFLVGLTALLLTACQEQEVPKVQPQASPAATVQEPSAAGNPAVSQRAVARLSPTQGNEVTGTVTFIRRPEGVEVIAEIHGLKPGQQHGFHVHETGDCSAPDASSAGGHFNPQQTPHGAPDSPPAERHAGDLGNLEAGPDGTAHYQRLDPLLQLEGPDSIVGKAVLVHAQPDDFTSQPAGESGPRLACGVIEQEQEK